MKALTGLCLVAAVAAGVAGAGYLLIFIVDISNNGFIAAYVIPFLLMGISQFILALFLAALFRFLKTL